MIAPLVLVPSSNVEIDARATRSGHVIIEGDASTVTTLEISPDGGEQWRETMPEGVTNLTNIGAFVIEFAEGLSYRIVSGSGGEGVNVYFASR